MDFVAFGISVCGLVVRASCCIVSWVWGGWCLRRCCVWISGFVALIVLAFSFVISSFWWLLLVIGV